MTYTSRPYAGWNDIPRVLHFASRYAAQAGWLESEHVIDLPYRLSSWALDNPANVQLWQEAGEAGGEVVAYTALQQPWLSVDYLIRPGAERELAPQILAWAVERAQAMADQSRANGLLFAWANADASELERVRFYQAYGFTRSDWVKLRLKCVLDTPMSMPVAPEGFRVRPLAGDAEVPAYVALHRAAFGTTNMTEEWRRRTLNVPQHALDLDIVAVAPDGQLVAFCIVWLSADGSAGQVEPVGVQPSYQRLGLGRAVLLEGLRRLGALGAHAAYVDADGDNDPAAQLYTSAGFKLIHTSAGYSRAFQPA
jgi:ribosomal protein S18 acetylase RimI-like enzyme